MPGTESSRSSFSRHRGGAPDGCVDVLIEPCQLPLKGINDAANAFLQGLVPSPAQGPVSLCRKHLHDLPATGQKISKCKGFRIWQRSDLGLGCFGKAGNDRGIKRVCLGIHSQGLGVVVNLFGVHHDDRQRRSRECRDSRRLEASRGLDGDHRKVMGLEADHKLFKPIAVPVDGKGFSGRMDVNIQLLFRDIDTNKLLLILCGGGHLIPSLSKRASI